MDRGREKTDRNPQSGIRNPRGIAYVALIVAIVIIGISLGAAGKFWSYQVLRDKEEELLFRGDQYRLAIERYILAPQPGGRQQYPASIEDLLKDSRTPEGKRHLRRQFKDPFTNEDFVPIQDPLSRGIIGVHSTSNKAPLKTSNFPGAYKDFEGKGQYSDWQFVSTIKPGPGLVPGMEGSGQKMRPRARPGQAQ